MSDDEELKAKLEADKKWWDEQQKRLDDELIARYVELGKTLIEQAEARYNKERQKAVLGEVQRLMRSRDEYVEKVQFCERAVAWYDAKLKALEAGEFKIGQVATSSAVAGITFNNQDFNRTNF